MQIKRTKNDERRISGERRKGVPDERAEALARVVQICRQGRSFYRHVVTLADAARFPFPGTRDCEFIRPPFFALPSAGRARTVGDRTGNWLERDFEQSN
jgi:hypothetical protein